MGKKIRISESQFKKVITASLNEEVEGNIVMSLGNNIIAAAWTAGHSYAENSPAIDADGAALKVDSKPYTAYIVGDTDSKPFIKEPYNPGNYNTPPEGGEVYWEPKVFYPSYVYAIYNNGNYINDEYAEAIYEYIVEKLPKIDINNNYELIINKEDFDNDDGYDIDPYDDVNDR